ncbi:MAG TPA: cellulase family glycosylhydrolase [Cellvibrionaceae bacterium]|nr:cellulase family glycosylhydrolase [Cellvibrionaceae bacterium]
MNLKQLVLGMSVAAALGGNSAYAGFSVNGSQLLEGNGNVFIMRGINHAHTWYSTRTTKALADIAATGANTVRVVLSDGQQWTKTPSSEVANIIKLCKDNKLICMLEVHDGTGYGEQSAAGTVAKIAQYWVEIAPVLKGQENYVLINIANEHFGNGVAA